MSKCNQEIDLSNSNDLDDLFNPRIDVEDIYEIVKKINNGERFVNVKPDKGYVNFNLVDLVNLV